MIKVQFLQQMFDSIFKIHFPVVVIVVDVVGDIDNGVDGRNNETKETKRGHPILRYTLCLSLLFIMFMIKVMVMLIDMVLLIVLIMVRLGLQDHDHSHCHRQSQGYGLGKFPVQELRQPVSDFSCLCLFLSEVSLLRSQETGLGECSG